ncbi:MAG: hypothetical protein JNN15_11325 [Blastocatellia bacterium]|nr:hypothetical protein [Blastocatellia bacterium]
MIEAADTPPFFHHHLVATLEEAVAFYGSAAFNGPGSIGAGPVPVSISSNPNDPEVQAISAFLRLLNAVENIRSTVSIAQTAQQTNSVSKKRDLIRLALADNNDAIEVLTSGAYATNRSANVNLAIVKLQESKARLEEIVRGSASGIDQVIGVAILAQREARAALVDPNTLPVSFKN